MAETVESCTRPVRGPILDTQGESVPVSIPVEEKKRMTARVGKPAPAFESNAFVGKGFKTVRLSDYRGHWVLVCFYPGDFTFV